MGFIAGAVFSALAAACAAGAIFFGDRDVDSVFYFLAEAGAFVVAALTFFGVFG
ncbi:MAG: hypothetical protein AB7R89_07600 [Dehalococcoidia bacterium]